MYPGCVGSTLATAPVSRRGSSHDVGQLAKQNTVSCLRKLTWRAQSPPSLFPISFPSLVKAFIHILVPRDEVTSEVLSSITSAVLGPETFTIRLPPLQFPPPGSNVDPLSPSYSCQSSCRMRESGTPCDFSDLLYGERGMGYTGYPMGSPGSGLWAITRTPRTVPLPSFQGNRTPHFPGTRRTRLVAWWAGQKVTALNHWVRFSSHILYGAASWVD